MIRLLVADDHAIFREGLKQILSEHADLQIVGEATNGQQLLDLLAESPCDIVLLDLSMPGRSGIGLLADVVTQLGNGRLIVLSMHDEHQYVIESLKAGAAGYVTKSSASQQLIQAIRKVANHEMFISATAQRALPQAVSADAPHERLTPREREIYDLLVQGRKISDIARKLDLSIKTVSTHKTNILQKFEATTVVDLVHYALRRGLQ
jgi:DNA-binding NarL/FixJ family response regulator